MSETPSEALTDFLKGRAGDYLRSVLFYDKDYREFRYLRDDVADQYSDDEVAEVLQDVRLEAVEKPHQEDLYSHGSLNCTVRCFDGGVELHFPHDETSGTVVALDAEILEKRATFVGECLSTIETPAA